MVVYKEQYKATMVDQELDEAKVVEGEWHTKSKAPNHHYIYNLRALNHKLFVFFCDVRCG